MLCYVMLYYVMLCHVTLRYVMLCSGMVCWYGMHVCMYFCMHACMHVCMYVCIQWYHIHANIYTYIYIYIYTYTYHHISIYIYLYTHTYIIQPLYIYIYIWIMSPYIPVTQLDPNKQPCTGHCSPLPLHWKPNGLAVSERRQTFIGTSASTATNCTSCASSVWRGGQSGS